MERMMMSGGVDQCNVMGRSCFQPRRNPMPLRRHGRGVHLACEDVHPLHDAARPFQRPRDDVEVGESGRILEVPRQRVKLVGRGAASRIRP
jgi:hypothetical protein